jgi:hypothetical protein
MYCTAGELVLLVLGGINIDVRTGSVVTRKFAPIGALATWGESILSGTLHLVLVSRMALALFGPTAVSSHGVLRVRKIITDYSMALRGSAKLVLPHTERTSDYGHAYRAVTSNPNWKKKIPEVMRAEVQSSVSLMARAPTALMALLIYETVCAKWEQMDAMKVFVKSFRKHYGPSSELDMKWAKTDRSNSATGTVVGTAGIQNSAAPADSYMKVNHGKVTKGGTPLIPVNVHATQFLTKSASTMLLNDSISFRGVGVNKSGKMTFGDRSYPDTMLGIGCLMSMEYDCVEMYLLNNQLTMFDGAGIETVFGSPEAILAEMADVFAKPTRKVFVCNGRTRLGRKIEMEDIQEFYNIRLGVAGSLSLESVRASRLPGKSETCGVVTANLRILSILAWPCFLPTFFDFLDSMCRRSGNNF